MLPEWFYNRVMDTYVVYNTDIDTIVSNVKVPFKFQGFNFALLLEDAFRSDSENVYKYFKEENFRYTETFWNFNHKAEIEKYDDADRDQELKKSSRNVKLVDLEKGVIDDKEYSKVRDYKFKLYKTGDEVKIEAKLIKDFHLLGIQEFVNELNHHLFLEGENVAGQFLQKYLEHLQI